MRVREEKFPCVNEDTETSLSKSDAEWQMRGVALVVRLFNTPDFRVSEGEETQSWNVLGPLQSSIQVHWCRWYGSLGFS